MLGVFRLRSLVRNSLEKDTSIPALLIVLFSFSPFIMTSLKAEEIAMSYTEDTNNRTAVNKFILVLQDPNRAFNAQPFPANESGEEAFAKCRDNESAQAYCPKRWSAMNDWVNNSIEVKIKV